MKPSINSKIWRQNKTKMKCEVNWIELNLSGSNLRPWRWMPLLGTLAKQLSRPEWSNGTKNTSLSSTKYKVQSTKYNKNHQMITMCPQQNDTQNLSAGNFNSETSLTSKNSIRIKTEFVVNMYDFIMKVRKLEITAEVITYYF